MKHQNELFWVIGDIYVSNWCELHWLYYCMSWWSSGSHFVWCHLPARIQVSRHDLLVTIVTFVLPDLLLGVIPSLVDISHGHEVSMTFIRHTSKRLDGCVYRTVGEVPLTLLCSQVCISVRICWWMTYFLIGQLSVIVKSFQLCNDEVVDCQSFNYISSTQTCELSSCSHTEDLFGSLSHVTLKDDADSEYYQMMVIPVTVALHGVRLGVLLLSAE